MQNLNFWQQVLATLTGTFIGFIFSIFLFYLTEKWKNDRNNKKLTENVQRELKFNLDFLTTYKAEFEKMLRQISAGQKNTTIIFKHNKIQKQFLLEAFSSGILYKYLTTEELKQVDAMINYFQQYRDSFLWDQLVGYTNDSKSAQEVLGVYEWDRDQLDLYFNLITSLKEKLKTLK